MVIRFTNPSANFYANVEKSSTGKGYWVTFYTDPWGVSTAGSQYAPTLAKAKQIAHHYAQTGEWRTFGARMG